MSPGISVVTPARLLFGRASQARIAVNQRLLQVLGLASCRGNTREAIENLPKPHRRGEHTETGEPSLACATLSLSPSVAAIRWQVKPWMVRSVNLLFTGNNENLGKNGHRQCPCIAGRGDEPNGT